MLTGEDDLEQPVPFRERAAQMKNQPTKQESKKHERSESKAFEKHEQAGKLAAPFGKSKPKKGGY